MGSIYAYKGMWQLKKWHKGVDARANVRLYLRGQKQTTKRKHIMKYAQLQAELKKLRSQGKVDKGFRLNQRLEILQAEYTRVTGKQQTKQETQEIDELQALRDELAAAKATIAKQAARIQELEQQQQPEPEPEQHRESHEWNDADWDDFWQAAKEADANDPDIEAKVAACQVNGEIIQQAMAKMQTEGKKATLKWLKAMFPKFHSDTCTAHGNTFNIYQWEGFVKLIDSIRDDEFIY